MTAVQAQSFSDEMVAPMEAVAEVEAKPRTSFLEHLMAAAFLLAALVATGGWFWLLGQLLLSFLWPW
jgi:hypothetical protein